jgi:hypothetical protein
VNAKKQIGFDLLNQNGQSAANHPPVKINGDIVKGCRFNDQSKDVGYSVSEMECSCNCKMKIWSDLMGNHELQEDSYVYAYLDPRKIGPYTYGCLEFSHEPFYIGRGINGRIMQHLKKAKQKGYSPYRRINRIKGILKSGNRPIIFKIVDNLIYQHSIDLEIDLISIVGRKSVKEGPLLNLTEGGEGFRGLKHSEETKRLIAEKVSGKNSGLYGRKRTPDEIRRISEKQKGILRPESGPKISKALTGRKLPKEVCERMSESRMGMVFTEERRANISKALKGKMCGPKDTKMISRIKKVIKIMTQSDLSFNEANFDVSRYYSGCLTYKSALKWMTKKEMLKIYNNYLAVSE